MSNVFHQVFRFVAVGCAAAATHWAVAVLCIAHAGLPPLVANVAGWLTAFVVSFAGHFRLTFRHADLAWRQAARRFFVVSASGFAVNECAYAWLLHASGIRYDLLLALILVAVAALTFIASRWWAFRRSYGA